MSNYLQAMLAVMLFSILACNSEVYDTSLKSTDSSPNNSSLTPENVNKAIKQSTAVLYVQQGSTADKRKKCLGVKVAHTPTKKTATADNTKVNNYNWTLLPITCFKSDDDDDDNDNTGINDKSDDNNGINNENVCRYIYKTEQSENAPACSADEKHKAAVTEHYVAFKMLSPEPSKEEVTLDLANLASYDTSQKLKLKYTLKYSQIKAKSNDNFEIEVCEPNHNKDCKSENKNTLKPAFEVIEDNKKKISLLFIGFDAKTILLKTVQGGSLEPSEALKQFRKEVTIVSRSNLSPDHRAIYSVLPKADQPKPTSESGQLTLRQIKKGQKVEILVKIEGDDFDNETLEICSANQGCRQSTGGSGKIWRLPPLSLEKDKDYKIIWIENDQSNNAASTGIEMISYDIPEEEEEITEDLNKDGESS